MALVFPRDMIGGLPWWHPRLALRFRQEISRDAYGRAQAKDLGSPIWTASFRSAPVPQHEADAAMANFRSLGGALRSFYVFDPARAWPASLSSPAPLANATVSIRAKTGDNTALALQGVPAGLELRPGDYLSIHTSTQGRELVQLVTGGIANGLGNTPELKVVPSLRPSVAIGQAVDLDDPMVEMRLDPGSLDDPFEGMLHRVVTFTASQVIR